MKTKRIKLNGTTAVYHCMKRTVNGEMLFKDREKEVLRKMLWQVSDFSGVIDSYFDSVIENIREKLSQKHAHWTAS